MIVVADTSPLNYLLQIDLADVLSALYSQIALPAAVVEELRHAGSPAVVRGWSMALPSWAVVYPAGQRSASFSAGLGLGERDAIELAQVLHADLLLIDDEKGKRTAEQFGLRSTGTLGVLLRGAERRMLDPFAAFKRLTAETNFHSSAAVERRFFELAQEVMR
jgi:predicted nucleic acid-binding protein